MSRGGKLAERRMRERKRDREREIDRGRRRKKRGKLEEKEKRSKRRSLLSAMNSKRGPPLAEKLLVRGSGNSRRVQRTTVD